MADYIPVRDGDFDLWAQNFSKQLAQFADPLSISAEDRECLERNLADWKRAHAEWLRAQAAAKGATEEKRRSRKALEQTIRRHARVIQAQPGVSETTRIELGLKAPRKRTSKLPPPTEAPKIELDFGTRGVCKIHFGTMPTNERLNRMAENAKRVVIEYRTSDEDSWQYLALATASPYVHELGCTTPVGVEYRAHYISPSCAPGPLSDPVSAIIQAAA